MKKLLTAILFFIMLNSSHAQHWDVSGLGDSLTCFGMDMLYVTDSSLYAVGDFWNSGPVLLQAYGKFCNGKWHALGQGDPSDYYHCIINYRDTLLFGGLPFAGGAYSYRKWDGHYWHFPFVCGGQILNWGIYQDTLIAGGFGFLKFLDISDNTWKDHHISCPNPFNFGIYSIKELNGVLYASHESGISYYTGNLCWVQMPVYPYGRVKNMAVDTFNTFLYASGDFLYLSDGTPSYYAAMWDGFKWNSMDTLLNAPPSWHNSTCVYRCDLYIDGDYSHPQKDLTRWDGEQYIPVESGTNGYGRVGAMAVYNDTLFVGGNFKYVDSTMRAYGFAKWFMPNGGCGYLKPRLYTLSDTFYISNGIAPVQFYNNNPYADSWQWNFGNGFTDTIQNPLYNYSQPGTYTVSVTVIHSNCIKTVEKEITVLFTSGLGNQNMTGYLFKVYPNPVNGLLKAECTIPSEMKNAVIRIYGSNGMLLEELAVPCGYSVSEIATFGWKKDVYLVGLYSNNKQLAVERIVKE